MSGTGAKKSGSRITTKAVGFSTPVTATQEQDALLRAKQTELDQIFNRHDDLVREKFHLDRFVTLVSYNHEEAKADTSEVWQKWKQENRHDLLQDAPVASDASGGRTTRRARQQVAATLHSPAAIKSTGAGSPSTHVPSGSSNSRIWDVLSGGKPFKKGYGKPALSPHAAEAPVASISAPLPLKVSEKGEARAEIPATPTPKRPRGRPRKVPRPATEMESFVDESNSPRKRRKTDRGGVATPTELFDLPFSPSPSAPVARRKSHQPYTLGLRPPSPVKRIRLIVRTPEPYYSSPAQKPPPQVYGGSLSAALENLHSQSLDESAEAEVRTDAEILERVAALRERGRMLLSASEVEALEADSEVVQDIEQQDPRTVWDFVVEDVRLWHDSHEMDTGPRAAATVASKVRGYWEAHAAKEDKARQVEEKRLRGLAKATMKLVIGEWKKAVYHLREQDRVAKEEEQKRLGREHLDAILDQSGQILESQQLDLARTGRSQSLSTTASFAEEEEEYSNDADTVLDEEEEGGQDEEGQLVDEDADGMIDVARDLSVQSSSREGSLHDDGSWISHDDPSANDDDEADDEETYALLGGHQPLRGYSSADGLPPFDPMSPSSDLISTPSMEDSMLSRPEPQLVASPPMYSIGLAHRQNHDPTSHTLHGIDTFEASIFSKSIEDGTMMGSPVQRRFPTPIVFTSPPAVGTATASSDGDAEMALALAPVPSSVDPALLHARDDSPPAFSAGNDGNDQDEQVDEELDATIPRYLKPFAVAPVDWDPDTRVMPPALLRGVLRPYQHAGLEWLASLHTSNLNGILADEMGLGKTIQTISLLAHLACDRGIWGPHLIIVPTSVLLNWEMEFKKFLPGFRVLAYHGTTKRRKELRQGWNDKYRFNVCVTSYTLASRDAHIFKRKPWYYMILDEAHMIKNFRSQRWNVLLMFRSFRRLLLTGTPLQNNLTELWALLQFLMSGTNFANLKEFGEWFANPLEKAIEDGTHHDDETLQRVTKLHTVLRPYLLRRLKRDVEKELPSKYEHLVFCPLSKRQRFLYDEFMSRADTQTDLSSGQYQKIANVLMQLRKVCNHPDLFEVRPVVTSFAVTRAAVADFEIKELLLRRTLLQDNPAQLVNLTLFGLDFSASYNTSEFASMARRRLDGTDFLPFSPELEAPPAYDVRTVEGFKRHREYQQRAARVARWTQIAYINRRRCVGEPVISSERIAFVQRMVHPILPLSAVDPRSGYLNRVLAVNRAVKSFEERAEDMAPFVDRFAFATPPVVALGMPHYALMGAEDQISALSSRPLFDATLHRAAVKLQVGFPDRSLLQYDCGKLQRLAELLRLRKDGGHRVLIFTQMTRILDILEQFLTFHGWLYLRLDGGTKIEDRQYITERFNSDPRILCFIASSRSGGVGINLTGADTVIFYDSDFNPQMDKQCEDRAHRIGQIRDVHIYRFISQHTVEEAMLRKANQKRSLDDLVIQRGEFDWRSLFGNDLGTAGGDDFVRALEDYADTEDAQAARVAAQEAGELEGADKSDFGEDKKDSADVSVTPVDEVGPVSQGDGDGDGEEEEEGGSTVEYMLAFVQWDSEHFSEWRL